MTKPQVNLKRLVRPTLDTRFHIDYDWWKSQSRDLDVFIASQLESHDIALDDDEAAREVDWVNPITGEVERISMALYLVRTVVARSPDFITPNTALTEAVFRLLLANGNRPMTAGELLAELGRTGQEQQLLRLLSSPRVYKGLRPCL